MRTIVIALVALLQVTSAQAACAYGEKNLGGSLPPGQGDDSRSYTVEDTALFRVEVRTGGPIDANIGCGWRRSRSHACRVYDTGELHVRLFNNTGATITYRWICEH